MNPKLLSAVGCDAMGIQWGKKQHAVAGKFGVLVTEWRESGMWVMDKKCILVAERGSMTGDWNEPSRSILVIVDSFPC